MPIIIERRVIEILSCATIPHRGPKSRSVKKYRIIHGRPIESDQLQTSAERNASIVPPPSPFSLTTQQFHYFPPLFSSRAISVIIVRGDASIDRSIERSTPSAHQLLRARRNGCRLNRSSAFPPPFVGC